MIRAELKHSATDCADSAKHPTTQFRHHMQRHGGVAGMARSDSISCSGSTRVAALTRVQCVYNACIMSSRKGADLRSRKYREVPYLDTSKAWSTPR